jgi:hypothetical protein
MDVGGSTGVPGAVDGAIEIRGPSKSVPVASAGYGTSYCSKGSAFSVNGATGMTWHYLR